VLAAAVVAGTTPGAVRDTTTTTGPATTTGSTSTTISTTTTTTPVAVLPRGVTIAGIAVGGLTPQQAYTVVRSVFERPLAIVAGRHRYAVSPERLGAVAYALKAVQRARTAAPGTAIPLQITVRTARVRAYVDTLARRLDRAPVDSRLFLRNLKPWISKDRAGSTLLRTRAASAITGALRANRKGPVRLRARTVAAKVTRRGFGPVIVIRRGSNRLYLYNGMRLARVFGVATGQSIYPTPLGRFSVVVKWRNPWWYPPNSPWAVGEKPTPPGPGNPLGTRWMGLSAPGVGIHGTPNDGSIGYSVSHGCIRMHIPDAEWLFERVQIGTTVFIVAA
jgi:lipoprotein-anchoring transpeptidase ErfK/SrfK